jgi:hypothetical protein
MASEALSRAFRDLYSDMADGWRNSPPPMHVAIGEGSRADQAEIQASAVAYGWIARVVRTGEAAIGATHNGYATEVAPLVRSMIEHAIGLWWLADQRGIAYQALVRARSNRLLKFQKAQDKGWALDGPELQQLLQDAIDLETDDDTRPYDRFLHVAAQATEYDLVAFYQAWLIETGMSHANIDSARPYFDVDEANLTATLRESPREPGSEVEAAAASALHTALIAYNRFLPDDHLGADLIEWERRFADLGRRLQAEHRDEPAGQVG